MSPSVTPSVLDRQVEGRQWRPGSLFRTWYGTIAKSMTNFASTPANCSNLSSSVNELISYRLGSLSGSPNKAVASQHVGNINSLCLDGTESRYLLAAAADSSIAVYDTQYLDDVVGQSCLLKIDRTHSGGHKFSVTTACWYPIDTGLFVTGSHDRTVKVWDANSLSVAFSFGLPAQVTAVSMSNYASQHCLIACATASPEVRLCDPVSGSLSHTLVGHRDAVWCTAWSVSSEWQLLTGGADGQVRVWDIRSSGCVYVFNQHATTMGARHRPADKRSSALRRRSPESTATAHEGSVTAICQTPDTLHWVTSGTDQRIRLWSSDTFRNKLVNYRMSANRAGKGRQIAIAETAQVLFHPSGSVVQVYDIFTGELMLTLRGHMDAINACCFNSSLQELYTGSNDQQICVWSLSAGEERDSDCWTP